MGQEQLWNQTVQSLSRVWLCDPMDCSTPSFPVHHQLKHMSIESVMSSNHLILCCPLFLLPSIFPSIRVFSNKSVLHIRWPKDWSFSFSISPSNEYTGLISFRIDWFDPLAVQGTLKTAWVQILPLPNYHKHFPRQAMSPHRPQLSHLQNGHLQRLSQKVAAPGRSPGPWLLVLQFLSCDLIFLNLHFLIYNQGLREL